MAGIAFNPLDKGLGIEWPIAVDAGDPAQLSAKDAAAPNFSEPAGK
jgi:dTDP-4-dehydrorhamnose 3,5-epimerase